MSEIMHQVYKTLTSNYSGQKNRSLLGLIALLCLAISSTALVAGEVDVVDVSIKSTGGRNFQIDATLKHGDTGWDHYANKWIVIDENGNVIGERILAHPHVREQPFTRSVRVTIPESVKTVTIVAFDSVHEDGGAQMSIEVPAVN